MEPTQSVLAALLVAQADPGINVDIGTADSLVGSAVGAFLTTLVVGAILIAIAPAFTERMMTDVLADPMNTFLYGILSIVGIAILRSTQARVHHGRYRRRRSSSDGDSCRTRSVVPSAS